MGVDSESIQNTLSQIIRNFTWAGLFYIIILTVVCVLVYKLIMAAARRMLTRNHTDSGLAGFILSILRVVLCFLVTLIIVDALGVPITSLVALFSVAGLALSLAMQGALSNLAGGMMILWTKPFKVGDFIEVDGLSGTVKEVRIVYTKIAAPDNRIIYLTNKSVSEANVVNYSAETTRRIELTVSASYDSPMEEVKAAIREVIDSHPKTLSDPEPVVRVAEFGASSIQYHVRAWCPAGDCWPTRYDLNEGIKKAFDEKGLEMTYDHLNVHILDDTKQKA